MKRELEVTRLIGHSFTTLPHSISACYASHRYDSPRNTTAPVPPEAADEITADREGFRVVKSDPPTDQDFRSQRAMQPAAVWGNSECLAFGLSVFAENSSAPGPSSSARHPGQ